MEHLKPCPFCGVEPETERHGTRRFSTTYACTECGYRLETGEEFNHGERWDTRADGWQPIDSAQSDANNLVLLTDGDLVWVGIYFRADGGGSFVVSGGRDKAPTHWMPLPAPPQEKAE